MSSIHVRKESSGGGKARRVDRCVSALGARSGVFSPDCAELDPNNRQVRRKPKQRGAVVGFMAVLGSYPPLNSHVQQRSSP